MGEEWRAMPDDIKAPYVAKAEAAKAQYDKDKQAYGESNTLPPDRFRPALATPRRKSILTARRHALAEATKW